MNTKQDKQYLTVSSDNGWAVQYKGQPLCAYKQTYVEALKVSDSYDMPLADEYWVATNNYGAWLPLTYCGACDADTADDWYLQRRGYCAICGTQKEATAEVGYSKTTLENSHLFQHVNTLGTFLNDDIVYTEINNVWLQTYANWSAVLPSEVANQIATKTEAIVKRFAKTVTDKRV